MVCSFFGTSCSGVASDSSVKLETSSKFFSFGLKGAGFFLSITPDQFVPLKNGCNLMSITPRHMTPNLRVGSVTSNLEIKSIKNQEILDVVVLVFLK